MAHAVIMAGGQGERFWPLTSEEFPKYLIRLDGKNSLLQKAYGRLLKIYDKKKIHVVTTKNHVPFIRKVLPSLTPSNIITEPFRRNTAPAIFLSTALLAERFGGQEVVSFFPADHLIQNETAFRQTIKNALTAAGQQRVLVTVGIQPAFPATGYGYIHTGRPIVNKLGAYRVKSFKEKPSRRIAQGYLRKKNFLWNAGIFAWRADVFLEAMRKFAPQISRGFHLKNLNRSYERLPRVSIDYALMEKADNVAVIKTRMDWCDMGNWDMFFEKAKKDKNGNTLQGAVRQKECKGTLLANFTGTPLAVVGLQNFIVVRAGQGTLICRRSQSEESARFGAREQ